MLFAVSIAIGRWSRLHPLGVAALLAIPVAALAAFVMAGFLADARGVYGAAVFAFVVAGGIAAFGAFLGWLRRKHLEGIG